MEIYMKIKLTQGFINSATCPADKLRIEYCDTELPGLYLLVSPAGNAPSYYLRYKDSAGKTCHQKLGRSSDISLADARKQARTLKAEITANGRDPRAEEKARKAVLTLDELWLEYKHFAKSRKRSFARDEQLWRLRLQPEFGHLRLNQISRHQAQSFHAGLKEAGILSASSIDHHLKLLRRMLNLAVDWGMLEKNPVSRIQLLNEDNKVEQYLDEAELEQLFNVLQNDENRPVCLIALLLISTGCRLNEVLSARWQQIDRVNRVFRVDAINSKSKRVRSIPLNDSALEVLSQLDTEGQYEHLFINKQTEKPYTTIMKVWTRLRTKAGLPHLRIHDLRHQYASFLVNSGRTLYEVQQILGHSDSKVTERYAHLSTKTLQAAANSASVIIKGSMKEAA
jgi:integrase